MTLEARLLEWGEDWARARGYWAPEEAPLWWVLPFEGGLLRVCLRAPRVGGWTLTPLQFWLWAHAVDTGRTDSQRCPDCAHRGGPMEWRLEPVAEELGVPVYQAAARRQAEGWSVASYAATGVHMSRPCPTCTGPAVECDHDGGMRAFRDIARPDVPARCVKCVETEGTIPGEPLGYISRPLARVVCEARQWTCPECRGLGEGADEDGEWDCETCGGDSTDTQLGRRGERHRPRRPSRSPRPRAPR